MESTRREKLEKAKRGYRIQTVIYLFFLIGVGVLFLILPDGLLQLVVLGAMIIGIIMVQGLSGALGNADTQLGQEDIKEHLREIEAQIILKRGWQAK